jgi:hypothetical protein
MGKDQEHSNTTERLAARRRSVIWHISSKESQHNVNQTGCLICARRIKSSLLEANVGRGLVGRSTSFMRATMSSGRQSRLPLDHGVDDRQKTQDGEDDGS